MATARVAGPDGVETYAVPLPAVVTVLEGGVEPRYPTISGRMKAKKVKIETVAPQREPARLRPGAAPAAARPAERGRGARRGTGRGEGRGRPAGEAGGGAMILVFVETDLRTGGATEVSRETVTFARTLAERTGGPVHAVVVGDRPDGLVDQLGAYGVTEVHHATGDAVAAYGGAAWAAAVQAAVAATDADVVLAPGTPRGMEVAAHLAARLDVPMAANVVGSREARPDPLRVTRQVVGGCGPRGDGAARAPRRAHGRGPRRRGRARRAGHRDAARVHPGGRRGGPGGPGGVDRARRGATCRAPRSRPRGSSSAPGAGPGRRTGSTPPRSWRSCSAVRSASPAW